MRKMYTFTLAHAGVNPRLRLALLLLLPALLWLATPQSVHAQDRVYVDKDAPGPTYNGSSWANAYTTL